MRRINKTLQAVGMTSLLIGMVVFGLSSRTQADAANAPSLVISQLKITSSNGQFITLYNSTNATVDMSKYQLEYFNNYDLTKATSSRLISLSGSVPPHGYFMVNDSSLLLCYQLTVDSLSLGLSSTAGMIQLVGFSQGSPSGAVNSVLQDYVAWTKTPSAGAQTLPANTNALLMRQPAASQSNPTTIASPGAGSWIAVQPDAASPCSLIGASGSNTPLSSGMNQLLPSSEPPASIDSATSSGITALSGIMPPSDIGLMGPQLTELMPNPVGTGNDSTDEFIELYNPNPVAFDLSGFSLQVGTTSLKTYTFPASTVLPPSSFKAFYSKDTNLGLSNSSGQARLLDPFGNSISASANYTNAKDGISWSLAQGKWYWTTSATPNSANVIHEPAIKKSSVTVGGPKKKTAAKTSNSHTKKLKSMKTSYGGDEQDSLVPVHPGTLALIGGAALLYGVYEYRADLANRVYQFRRYLSDSRKNR